jgi:hypothetical protein
MKTYTMLSKKIMIHVLFLDKFKDLNNIDMEVA